MSTPFNVFLSYAHEDEAHRETLGKHLSALVREGVITIWHDRKITGGREWAGAIDQALKGANIVLLLISADFLDSDYCNDVELAEAIRMHDANLARVVPVILRSCDWEKSQFARFNALPPDGKPIVEAEHPDQRFKAVATGLRAIVAELRSTEKIANSPTEIDQATPIAVSQSVAPPTAQQTINTSSNSDSEASAHERHKIKIGKLSLFGMIEIGPFEIPMPTRMAALLSLLLALLLVGAGVMSLCARRWQTPATPCAWRATISRWRN